jgi:pyruvate/2-oxoglutarate dehydrogenase complex dihydrolipoamide acyltransferase (E2) component
MRKRHDGYTIVPFPRMRRLMITMGNVTRHKHIMHGLVEIDVTRPRQSLQEYKARTGETLSFTAFIAACVGQAVEKYKEVHAYRNWRGQLILFDDVDIAIMVERDIQGQKIPLVHIIRQANTKTVRDIHEEIRSVQSQPARGREVKASQWLTLLPTFVRHLCVWFLFKKPRMIKKYLGTVGVTAIGMFGNRGGWGIGLPSLHTLSLVIGGIAERPALIDGKVEAHEFLSVTLNFDHDLIDGAPAARFTQHLMDLIESGYGLSDSTAIQEQTPESVRQ